MPFPRSKLFQLVCNHPVATAAIVVATVYVGPRRMGSMFAAGVQSASRNAHAIAPVLQQFIAAAGLRR